MLYSSELHMRTQIIKATTKKASHNAIVLRYGWFLFVCSIFVMQTRTTYPFRRDRIS